MSAPIVVRQKPPGPAVRDENGLTIPRRYSVYATSELNAENILRSFGVYRGAMFREDNGTIPQPYAICQRLTIDAKIPAILGGIGEYIVDVEYSTQQGVQRAVPGGPAVFSIQTSLTTSTIDLDVNGKPIIMSSEEPLDPPLTAMIPSEVVHAEFYVKAASAMDAYAPLRPYNAAVNSSTLWGATRGCLLCHVFKPQASDTGWVLCQVDFEYKKPWKYQGRTFEGWLDVFQDRGTREIVDSKQTDPSKRYKYITVPDDQGNRVQVESPVPLDGKGKKLSPTATPVYKTVVKYPYMNLASIPGMRFK